MLSTDETFQEERFELKADAELNMLDMSSTDETSQELRVWLKAAAPENMLPMSVTDETSQAETLPLNTAAPENMPDMSMTLERSGESVARYSMREAPKNAFSRKRHLVAPQLSRDTSFLGSSPPLSWNPVRPPLSWNPVRPPVTLTEW